MNRRVVALLCAGLLALLAGCAEPDAADAVHATNGITFDLSPAQAGRVRAARVDALAASVPEPIRQRGTLRVIGTVGSVPPLAFYATDNATAIGSEVDVAQLIGDVLGLRVQRDSADWAQSFVRIDSGAADLFISNVTVTEERKQKYDFATYRLDNLALEAPTDSTWTYHGPTDIAGKRIGVGSGTNQEQLLVDWNAGNVARGLAPAQILYYQNAADYYLALSSGRLDGYLGPSPSGTYHSESTGQTKILATFSGAGAAMQGEIAVLTKKGNGLIGPVAAALNEAIRTGDYRKVLDRWGLGSEAVDRSEVNPPGLPPRS